MNTLQFCQLHVGNYQNTFGRKVTKVDISRKGEKRQLESPKRLKRKIERKWGLCQRDNSIWMSDKDLESNSTICCHNLVDRTEMEINIWYICLQSFKPYNIVIWTVRNFEVQTE